MAPSFFNSAKALSTSLRSIPVISAILPALTGAPNSRIACAASTNALLGIDWYAGNDWSLSAQYAHKYVASGEHRNSGLATFRISKDLLRNTLTLQSFAYIDVTNGGIYNRLSADYALNDQLHATLGYDFFHADRGSFTVYDNNSEVFVKLKYSF